MAAKEIVLTIYDDKATVVQETRTVRIPPNIKQPHELTLTGFPSRIDPSSVHVICVTDPAAKVNEQKVVLPKHGLELNDSSSAGKYFRKEYLYQNVTILLTSDDNPITGRIVGFDAEADLLILLPEDSKNNLVFLPIENNIKLFTVHGLKEEVCDNLSQAKIAFSLTNSIAGDHLLNIIYQTTGIRWSANYTLLISHKEDRYVLSGRYVVQNECGKPFENVSVNLISSPASVNRQSSSQVVSRVSIISKAGVETIDAKEKETRCALRSVSLLEGDPHQFTFLHNVFPALKRKAFFECSPHLRLVEGTEMPHLQLTETDGASKVISKSLPAIVELENSVMSDLPRGPLRVYWTENDPSDSAAVIKRYVDTYFRSTNQGEILQLNLGYDVVGITAERNRTEFKKDLKAQTLTESFKIDIKNEGQPQKVNVVIEDSIFRWSQWRIDKSSHEWIRNGADRIRFNLILGLNEELSVTYTVVYNLAAQHQPMIAPVPTPIIHTPTATPKLPTATSDISLTSSGMLLGTESGDAQRKRGFFDLWKKEEAPPVPAEKEKDKDKLLAELKEPTPPQPQARRFLDIFKKSGEVSAGNSPTTNAASSTQTSSGGRSSSSTDEDYKIDEDYVL